jgi:glycosyltransferase involved in cell wall biosynthesis
MSILEALAAGVCVLATAVGGTPALLDHGRAGVLVPANDAPRLAAAMLQLLEDSPRRRALGIAGQRHVATIFGHDTMLDRYEAVYRPSSPQQNRSSTRQEPVCAE